MGKARRRSPSVVPTRAVLSRRAVVSRRAGRASSCTSAQLRLPIEVVEDDWHLDEHTRRIGRLGVAQARANLERCRKRVGGAPPHDVPPEFVRTPDDDREGQSEGQPVDRECGRPE